MYFSFSHTEYYYKDIYSRAEVKCNHFFTASSKTFLSDTGIFPTAEYVVVNPTPNKTFKVPLPYFKLKDQQFYIPIIFVPTNANINRVKRQ